MEHVASYNAMLASNSQSVLPEHCHMIKEVTSWRM